MAAITPVDIFPGFELVAAAGTVTAQSIVIPLTALPHLTAAEADEATGDGREVARQLDIAINSALAALPAEEKPTQMTSVIGVANLPTGNRQMTVTRTYELTAPVAQLSLVAEPA